MIQVWFVAAAVIVIAVFATGVDMTVSTAAMLLGVCLIPPALVLVLWPGGERQTVAEVLHNAERRN